MLKPSFRRRPDADGETIPIRALVTDDDDAFRAYFRVVLFRIGIDVVTAVDGEDALERLRSGDFDLLIADYEMPKMNGLELVAAVRADPALAGIYAVMLTGHEELSLKVAALSGGFDDYLSKSCSEVEVAAKVAAAQRILARHRALDRAAREWYGVAIRDELTGVFTRRYFFDEASRHLAEQRQITIVLFDIDDFKLANDRFGHVAGDRVLRDVGRLFLQDTRGGDIIARYGGDEFVLLVAGAPMYECSNVAERLERDIAALEWTFEEGSLRITASHGIASSSLIEDATIEQLLETADRGLYANKWLRKHPGEVRPAVYDYPPVPGAEVRPITADLLAEKPPTPAAADGLPVEDGHGERPSDPDSPPGQAADQQVR